MKRSALLPLGLTVGLCWPVLVQARPIPWYVSNQKAGISVDIDEPTKPWPEKGSNDDPAWQRHPSGVVSQDTTWIADWSFDAGGCDDTGWTHVDNRIRNDGVHYWSVNANYDGTSSISGSAAVLSKHDLCWQSPDGYGNDWDQSIILQYVDGNTLSVEFLPDTEAGYDFITVETDSVGLSENRVDYAVDPFAHPAQFRDELFRYSGVSPSTVVITGLPLTSNGPGTHEVYIRFFSDAGSSDEDGLYDTALDAALVVDDIVIGGPGGYSEDFEGPLHAKVSFANTAPATPYGDWARLFQGITDNDVASDNTTCAWLFTDDTTPTIGSSGNDYGPGGYVIREGIDNVLVSPWVSLESTSSSPFTKLSFRIFPGNTFSDGKIVLGVRARTRMRIDNTDTTTPSDSIDCVTGWENDAGFYMLSDFSWATMVVDITGAVPSGARDVQVSFRVLDWQLSGDTAPLVPDRGPGPYLDRVRLGRRVLGLARGGSGGPHLAEGIDARSQAQDSYAATVDGTISPGQHHAPSQTATSRFEGVPMNQGQDLGINAVGSPRIITGDSITIRVQDARGAGGITSVDFYGAIVEGPHAGKVPPGFVSGPGGFFTVAADSVRVGSPPLGPNVLTDLYFVDLGQEDPGYLRGGDRLVYFWGAEDAVGAFASSPSGLTTSPTSVAEAEAATGGLFEMSALPTIDWDPAYQAAIATLGVGEADPGPTPTQVQNSTQKNCILYYNQVHGRRRSGPLQRTYFMYTLDKLGYMGKYDIYDVSGYGNTNNQLFSRATINQLGGYELIVHDTGRSRDLTMTDGTNNDSEKINMQLNYQNWLSAAPTLHGVARATLWGVGENLMEGGHPANVTFWGNALGVSLASNDQGDPVPASSPDVVGKATNAWAAGGSTDWTDGGVVGEAALFTLDGGSPVARDYDGLGSSGSVLTHVYRVNDVEGDGAISIYDRGDGAGNAIVSSFGFFDIRPHMDTTVGTADPSADLVSSVLAGVLSEGCREEPNTQTGRPPGHALDVPRVTALYQSFPNPFNPATQIRFDLSRSGPVRLRIFDVGGHLVRTLVDERMDAARDHRVLWNGLDNNENRVSSGVYFYRLEAGDFRAIRKMVLVR